MRMRTKTVRHIEMFGMKAIVLRTAMRLADRTKEEGIIIDQTAEKLFENTREIKWVSIVLV